MKRFAFGLAAALATMSADAVAADLAYKSRARIYHERDHVRPVPRVYYQSVRPTMICRVGLLREKQGWPKERDRVARCVDLY